jgi:multiple sugar transport system ATP-binding protein
MADIRLDNLSKRFSDGFEAVKELSLDIAEAELLVLVGPSGCGKTTALRMVAGLEEITSGDLYIGGRRVNDVPEKDRDIAMVFQNYALYPHMTVAQNIAFSLKLARRPKAEIKRRVGDTARLLGLEELLDRRPKQLSGGQRQRVAMGRAIVREPQAFLMDEPLSNLDAQLRVHMRGEIEALQKRLGVTTLYVTHDQVEAMTMGDRVAVLRSGELQQIGTPTEVYDAPANLFVAGFMGSPPMNLARGTIESAEGGLAVRIGSTTLPVPSELARERLAPFVDKPVVVGIRPEDLSGADETGADGRPRMSVEIDRVEAVGSHLLGFFSVDAPPAKSEAVAEATGGGLEEVSLITREGTPFCATFEPRSAIRIGDRVEVAVDVRRLHFFDAEAELALGSEPVS